MKPFSILPLVFVELYSKHVWCLESSQAHNGPSNLEKFLGAEVSINRMTNEVVTFHWPRSPPRWALWFWSSQKTPIFFNFQLPLTPASCNHTTTHGQASWQHRASRCSYQTLRSDHIYNPGESGLKSKTCWPKLCRLQSFLLANCWKREEEQVCVRKCKTLAEHELWAWRNN